MNADEIDRLFPLIVMDNHKETRSKLLAGIQWGDYDNR